MPLLPWPTSGFSASPLSSRRKQMIGYVTVGSNDLDGNKLNVFYMDMSSQ
jgi:hypothetical protein